MAKTNKRKRDIKTKLMAAVCMLLVSSIMMVSTTYAWFTLSTAPEVTGITTAVGANGALEIALMPTHGVAADIQTTNNATDLGEIGVDARNITWGNLVDLSQGYGLDEIVLYPSALNATVDENGNPTYLGTALLSYPEYGVDGRVTGLSANTVTGRYSDGEFYDGSEFGVRAVGVASGKTERQLAWRNARSAAATAKTQATTATGASIRNRGNALADLAIAHSTAEGEEKYTNDDVAKLQAIVDDLQGTDGKSGALGYIEEAYVQYILGYAASAETTNDVAWSSIEAQIATLKAADDRTLGSVLSGLEATLNNEAGKTYDDLFDVANGGVNPITKLQATIASVKAADEALALLTDDDHEWSEISSAMQHLVDTDELKVNDLSVAEVKDNVQKLIDDVLGGKGLWVDIATGAGVYADIADHCGDFAETVYLTEITYGTLTVKNTKALMQTKSTVNPSYLTAMGSEVQNAGEPSSEGSEQLPMSDFYGYIVDLAFKTNAASSNLLLQQAAVDRIYDENTDTTSETMGHGSTMTFKATGTDMSDEQIAELMGAIRVVFFTPGTDNNTVICTAKLDMTQATVDTDGITAPLYVYELVAAYDEYTESETGTYKATTGEQINYVVSDTGTYYLLDDGTYSETAPDGEYTGSMYAKTTVTTTVYEPIPEDELDAFTGTKYTKTTRNEQAVEDNVIMALTQNTAHAVSVLVYLDGNKVSNGTVSATGTTSLTGKMNLQFASSANLVPMDYTQLMPQNGGSATETTTPAETTTPVETTTP